MKNTLPRSWTIAATLSVMLLIGCDNEEPINLSLSGNTGSLTSEPSNPHARIYHFGFDPRSSPQEDARQYLPLLKYLEKTTAYRFRLHFTQKDSDIIDEIGKGKLDFAAIGATSYIHAREIHHYSIVPVVRGKNILGKDQYRAYFVVRPDSDIDTITALPGHKLAFGSKTSTQGHLIPRIVMQQHGISLQQLSGYQYTGSHINCANAVVSGDADICAMQDTMAEDMAQQGLLRILFRSDFYPSSGIVANSQVDQKVIDKVRLALIAFQPMGKHSSTLYNWHKTEMPRGFVGAQDKDYLQLKQWMQKLGFLSVQAGS